jgi:hypothetical protein
MTNIYALLDGRCFELESMRTILKSALLARPEESGRFFEKKLRKKLLLLEIEKVSPPLAPGQKFFASFFQKRSASFI